MFPLCSGCFRFNYFSQLHAFFSEKDYTSSFFARWLPVPSHQQSLLLHALLELVRWFALANGMWLDEMFTPVCADALNVLLGIGLAFCFLSWEQYAPAGGCSLHSGMRRQCREGLSVAVWGPVERGKSARHVLPQWEINLCCNLLKLWGYLLLW